MELSPNLTSHSQNHLDDTDEYCWTDLQLASRNDDPDRVRDILAQDPESVNAPPAGYYGQTALRVACMRSHIEIRSRDVHAPGGSNFQHNALQLGCSTANMQVVRMLLDAGAEVNPIVSRYNGRTALQATAEQGHFELVAVLLELGADVNAPPSPTAGHTALQAAAHGGHVHVVQVLLNKGADVDAPAQSKMDLRRFRGHAWADLNASGNVFRGGTALHAALERNKAALVRKSLQAGADPNGEADWGRQTLLPSANRWTHGRK
ncbi:ankyrin repeat-containing domain protein [Diplogelasinospora grovesii]|uniref:Ankyrin repeat-containing domain protein n=1 Tax=Diplogelasinospora grovesii TaxID=303347 RepID=A0AAN6NCW0_9PEZI|nr:ankyrin repeat-containing domain protein [Diplogelasinospora grovesii]